MGENAKRNIRQELIEILEDYVDNGYNQDWDTFQWPWETEYADEYDAFIKSQPASPPEHLRIVSGSSHDCPRCYRMVLSSKGLTVPSSEFFRENLHIGMPSEDTDLYREYDDDICIFLWHCPQCGHSWKSVEAYETLGDGAWTEKLITDFWKLKGVMPCDLGDSKEERMIDSFARNAMEKWNIR